MVTRWLLLAAQVWPYLLGHYALSSLPEERQERDASTQAQYEATLSEWLAAEAMVRHREGLHTKLSSESTTSEIPLIGGHILDCQTLAFRSFDQFSLSIDQSVNYFIDKLQEIYMNDMWTNSLRYLVASPVKNT